MRMKLDRTCAKDDYTIGSLYIDGIYYCDTLEDTDRQLTSRVLPGVIRSIRALYDTAIPTGVYAVSTSYFQMKRRMLPCLSDVPGFGSVLIHRGNASSSGSGSILLTGEYKLKGKMINSTFCERRLVELLDEALERGEEITIEIANSPVSVSSAGRSRAVREMSEHFIPGLCADPRG